MIHKDKKLTIRLSSEDMDLIKKESKFRGIPVSQLVRKMIANENRDILDEVAKSGKFFNFHTYEYD